jgi:FixJ family two-component response regulator
LGQLDAASRFTQQYGGMAKAPIRVAIVDDEVSVRTALARLLSASSFEPTTYSSAREFIDSIRTDIPECLVVDVHMPDFTGLDLQRYLNRIDKKIPTVVITAFDDAGVRERSTASGAKAFLTKPLHGPTLIDAILRATGRACKDASPAKAANLRKRRS